MTKAEFVLLEVNGLFTYTYSLTAQMALCRSQPQNWTTILESAGDKRPFAWDREVGFTPLQKGSEQPVVGHLRVVMTGHVAGEVPRGGGGKCQPTGGLPSRNIYWTAYNNRHLFLTGLEAGSPSSRRLRALCLVRASSWFIDHCPLPVCSQGTGAGSPLVSLSSGRSSIRGGHTL